LFPVLCFEIIHEDEPVGILYMYRHDMTSINR